MGMYTGIRFKGVIKEKYRKQFSDIATSGDWEDSEIGVCREFGKIRRSHFIPCGALCYMPDSWEREISKSNLVVDPKTGYLHHKEASSYTPCNWVATDGFNTSYAEETGYWTFQCSLKNYEHEIEAFFKILPEIVDSVEHLEYYYEEWDYSTRYDIVEQEDGSRKVVCVDDKFICYREEENIGDNTWGKQE